MKYHHHFIAIWIAAVFFLGCPNVHATDLYVDGSVSASGSGLTWSEAKKTIKEALAIAGRGDVIRVAEGVYYETLQLEPSLVLEGGYPTGGGTRDIRAHETIIDGDFPDPPKPIIYMGSEDILDGFTLRNGTGYDPGGMGIYGGAIYCKYVVDIIINNTFYTNSASYTADGLGGAIYLEYSDSDIYNNIFIDNTVAGTGGGSAIAAVGSSPRIYNNYFYKNVCSTKFTTDTHGTIHFINSNGSINNNTFSENQGNNSGGIFLVNSSPGITNNILHLNSGYGIWENDHLSDPICTFNDFFENLSGCYYDEGMIPFTEVSVMNSTVYEASLNIECTPDFTRPDDYHLKINSCCIDAGVYIAGLTEDIDHDARPYGLATDIGCDEYLPDIPSSRLFACCVLLIMLFCCMILRMQ